jgi:hypothetical protein
MPIDALVIRTVPVPSLMHFIRRAHWWMLNWLDRILPTWPSTRRRKTESTCFDQRFDEELSARRSVKLGNEFVATRRNCRSSRSVRNRVSIALPQARSR